LADERRAARIAVLVGAGRVEVGGPWPHSPLADERRAARIAVLVGGGRVEVGGWSPEAGQWAVS